LRAFLGNRIGRFLLATDGRARAFGAGNGIERQLQSELDGGA
jgi:hypothetical protein